jgi:hypothetical protein
MRDVTSLVDRLERELYAAATAHPRDSSPVCRTAGTRGKGLLAITEPPPQAFPAGRNTGKLDTNTGKQGNPQ